MKVTLHRAGKLSYEADWNGHHYKVWKDDPSQEVWCITIDDDYRDGSYWLKDIRGSIESGDYE